MGDGCGGGGRLRALLGPTFLSSLLMMNYGKHPPFLVIENHRIYVTTDALLISE